MDITVNLIPVSASADTKRPFVAECTPSSIYTQHPRLVVDVEILAD